MICRHVHQLVAAADLDDIRVCTPCGTETRPERARVCVEGECSFVWCGCRRDEQERAAS